MTENEAINVLKMVEAHGCLVIEAKIMAIQALSEIQQYRAIGDAKQLNDLLIEYSVKSTLLEEYKAIGTIEELKAYKQGNCTNDCEHYDSAIEYVRNKAIDEFAEKLSFEISESIIWDMLATMSENGSLSDTSDEIVDYVIDTSKKIAEQLKAGEKNE